MATAIKQEERFNFRLSKDKKEQFERAASLGGKNLKEFVQSTALCEARRVLLELSIISMDSEERYTFLALLETDSEPTKAALNAASE